MIIADLPPPVQAGALVPHLQQPREGGEVGELPHKQAQVFPAKFFILSSMDLLDTIR